MEKWNLKIPKIHKIQALVFKIMNYIQQTWHYSGRFLYKTELTTGFSNVEALGDLEKSSFSGMVGATA